MMEDIIARFADGLNYDSETPEDFAAKKDRMREACEKVGRDFHELKWSIYSCTSVIGEDSDDFEQKKKDLLNQHWLFEEITEELKPKVLEVMITKYVSGAVDAAVEKLRGYTKEADIIVLGLPMMGDLRKNGLDTIRLLSDRIIPQL